MFFCCGTAAATAATAATAVVVPTEWSGAGLVFRDKHTSKVILCGYEPRKKYPALYGIGGKRETQDATPYETAFREAFEELCGIVLSKRHLQTLAALHTPYEVETHHGYVMFHYDFHQLETFLKYLKRQSEKSPFYSQFPQTLGDLLFKRKADVSTEMKQLCLLPLVFPPPPISNDLKEDIRRVTTDLS